MGDRRSFDSKEDLTQKISKSVFVTNFSDHFSARDLWNVCVAYGKVIDVYIPVKKSKAGKKFAFVRFLKVDNLDRLIDNLCTIWIGRLRLHANVVRFQREVKAISSQPKKGIDGVSKNSFASILKSPNHVHSSSHESAPAIVLDDSCITENDFSCSLMGKVQDINVLANLHLTFANEGFENVKLSYLGGYWVLIESVFMALKEKISNHVGVASWFQELIPASSSFVSDGRIVWVSVYWIRVKELEAWIPDLNNDLEDDSSSDEESECENDLVYDNHDSVSDKNGKYSKDAFGIYKLLNKKVDKEVTKGDDPTFPLGFTPVEVDKNAMKTNEKSPRQPHSSNVGNSSINSGRSRVLKNQTGGSILELMENLIEGLGQLTKKRWIQELNRKHKVNFVALRETKMESIDLFSIKKLWGNSSFDYVFSLAVGFFGGILCVWNPSLFIKDSVTISDYFLAIRVTWNGEYMILGDFNEVRSEYERFGTNFNALGANAFNHFITRLGLVDLPLEGYSYTWTHKSASKMSKLDRFLVSEGMVAIFPSLSAICLERHLSDHRPILMRELNVDYGPIPFRIYHSWFSKVSFDTLVEETWKSSIPKEVNDIISLKKKFQVLKSAIKQWCKEEKRRSNSSKSSIQSRLTDLDKMFDQGKGNVELVNERSSLLKDLLNLNASASLDMAQKAKIRWSIEGDENSKYFYGIINKKRSQLAIWGILVEGAWIDEPAEVKKEFFNHFANRFSSLVNPRIVLDSQFPSRLSLDQIDDLERNVSYEEIKRAVWDCGANKSPGPDGFTFEFFRRYWSLIDQDVVAAVSEFFSSSKFPSGCNASFITLIPKTQDAKLVKDFRPISLIGSIYKIITKIMANRIILFMSDLVSDVQSAFVANRQILDGPFILNELISWCKYKKTKAMIFKDSRLIFIKAIMGIGISQNDVTRSANHIGCKALIAPFSYLGVKVGGIPSRSNFWEDVIDKISVRLSKWKLKTLSIGGRLTLIKSVLSSMPLYQMSMYKVPMGILNRMESIRALDNPHSLPRRSNWLDIIREFDSISSKGINLPSHAKLKVGNGMNTSFWNDVWLSESPLKQCFPRLFALKDDKLVSVFDKHNDPSLIESFRRTPRGGIEDYQLHSLAENVAGVILSSQNDRWVWSLESSGLFSVKSARVCIDDFFLPYVGVSTR
ncbi:RNA-directed DNA polymerase, eukaryota [Tanacetum coccineum]